MLPHFATRRPSKARRRSEGLWRAQPRYTAPSCFETMALHLPAAAADADAPVDLLSVVSVPQLRSTIFGLLPADMRARCACVCPTWRTWLADESLWRRLDLSKRAGVTCTVTDAALRAAAARAHGGLQALNLAGHSFKSPRFAQAAQQGGLTEEALLEMVAANAETLRELVHTTASVSLPREPRSPLVESLARAAPRLRVFHADVLGSLPDFVPMLRGEPPYAALRVHHAHAFAADDENWFDDDELHAFAAAIAGHSWLSSLQLDPFPLNEPARVGALADAALACGLHKLRLCACSLSAASVPALARLLGGTALRELYIDQMNRDEEGGGFAAGEPRLFDAPGAALFAAALRANRTLESLTVNYAGMWRDADSAAATAVILGALTGHPSLRELDLSVNVCAPSAAHIVGAALGALVAANAPALHKLRFFMCEIPDDGLTPLYDALPANAHLRSLDVEACHMTGALLRSRLLPAVRANTSLTHLQMGHGVFVSMEQPLLEAVRRCDTTEELPALLPWVARWPDTAFTCPQRVSTPWRMRMPAA